MACNATDTQRPIQCQIKVFCLRGEKADVPPKVAALREEGEAEERVIDHIVSAAFRKTPLEFGLREGGRLKSLIYGDYTTL